jgi:hypothetical protein
MIVGSLLLILVAVTLLVMGLAAGSSTLLISSIAASLLAAVALVVGARQAASARAASTGPAGSPLAVDLDDDPGPAVVPADAHAGFGAGSAFAADIGFGADSGFGTDSGFAAASRRGSAETAGRGGDRYGDDRPGDGWSSVAVTDPDMSHPDHPGGADHADGPDDLASDRAAGSADTQILHGDRSDEDLTGPDPAESSPADPGYDTSAYPRDDRDEAAGSGGVDPHPYADGPGPIDAGSPDEELAGPMRAGSAAVDDGLPDLAQAGRDDVMAHLDADEIDEDPADEPLPQRVQPIDAVRVSRMHSDVLVVDGRPRYHLADCPHLDGRESEPIPVAEAVDLGFTPCGMCRPVDRLVAEAARR